MTQRDPTSRPSAEQALQQWRTIRGGINPLHRYWRLCDRKEPIIFMPFLAIIHVLSSVPRLVRLLGRRVRLIFT